MRTFFVVFTFVLSSLMFTGCGGKADNKNQSNANTSPTPATNSNSNANVAAKSTPLPEFTDADTAFAEGNKLFDANKTELAVEAFSQAVKLNPEFAEAWFKLGIAHSLIEKQNEVDALNQEVEETPTPTPAKKSKKDAPVVRTKDSEKAFEKAVAAYKKIVAKNPKDDAAYFNLGRAYNKLDEDEDADKALRQAVKLKPEETLYQTEFGSILIKLAKYDEAVKALKKAIDLDAENSLAAELLEKAEAGKRRINFGTTPKPLQQQDNGPKSKSGPKTDGLDKPETPETTGTKPPEVKPTVKKPEPPKKLDKAGN